MGQMHWLHGLQLTPPTDNDAANTTGLNVTTMIGASVEVEMVTVVAGEGVEGHPNGPQADVVRASILRLVLTDSAQVQGARNDALLKVIEQSVKALSDNKEGVSNKGSSDEEDYTDDAIHMEARHAVDALIEATGSAGEP